MGLDQAGSPSMDCAFPRTWLPPLDPGLLVFLPEESKRLGLIPWQHNLNFSESQV